MTKTKEFIPERFTVNFSRENATPRQVLNTMKRVKPIDSSLPSVAGIIKL